ncbi:MAG: hypothetical protein JRD89_02080 [Deltaproteobacteria bacterium]|nr:hypothetical protein [Deltaproteobacteria bacterium]
MTITIKDIRHTTVRLRVVRRNYQYFWPYWKEYERKYQFYKRPVGTRSLKAVDVWSKKTNRYEELGFAMPRAGRYPTKIKQIRIELSNGRVLLLADRRVRVAVGNATYQTYHTEDFLHNLHHQKPFPWNFFGGPVRNVLPNGVTINYEQALCLKVGQIVKRVKPLRLELCDRCVTDGDHSFPLARPYGTQWQDHWRIRFAQGITADNWRLFLMAVIGLPVRDVIELAPVRQRMRHFKKRRSDRECRRLIGQCFRGHRTASSVSVGKNLLFTLQRGGETLYVVDSPEYGSGLYVFDDHADAHAWASRNIDWREARARARLFRVHRGNWKEEVDAVLV